MAFIDLTKAFDSVNREALWKILSKAGCPEKYIRILRLLHDSMSATVLCSGSETEPFKVETGVKQGCIIAPTLFAVFIAAIIHLVGHSLPPGVQITYRTDGRLFNLNRFKAKSKISRTSIVELQYADDNAIVAHTETELQSILDAFARAYKLLGLSINVKKTKVLHQPPPDSSITPPTITINNTVLENVDKFPYLGSHLSSKADIDSEVHHRICCAGGAFAKLRRRVFENSDLLANTKILVYKAVILPTLLYGAETWTTYSRHIRALESYHQRCLRKILHISWKERRTNVSVLEEANMDSIGTIIEKHQLRWTGHVVRMSDTRLPKQLLYSELTAGQRAPGGPKKRFKDNIKVNLKNFRIDSTNWEALAQDRAAWRARLHEGATFQEHNLHRAATVKRQQRKERETTKAAPHPNPSTSHQCPHCNKVCGSRIGLFSHLRTHKKDPPGGPSYSTSSDRR